MAEVLAVASEVGVAVTRIGVEVPPIFRAAFQKITPPPRQVPFFACGFMSWLKLLFVLVKGSHLDTFSLTDY